MRSLGPTARAIAFAVLVSLLAGGVAGAAADRFILHQAPSYEYLLFRASGALSTGQVAVLTESGAVAHPTVTRGLISPSGVAVGVVIARPAPRGMVAVAVNGVVDIQRNEIWAVRLGHSTVTPGDQVRDLLSQPMGVALVVPPTGPITVLLRLGSSW